MFFAHIPPAIITVDFVNADADPHKPCFAEVGEANFDAEVLGSGQPVLVAFVAPWSRPCRLLDAVLGEVAAACAGTLRVVKANADDNPDLSLRYDIQSIPTLLYFVGGCPRAKVVGTASKEAILARLRSGMPGSGTGSI